MCARSVAALNDKLVEDRWLSELRIIGTGKTLSTVGIRLVSVRSVYDRVGGI